MSEQEIGAHKAAGSGGLTGSFSPSPRGPSRQPRGPFGVASKVVDHRMYKIPIHKIPVPVYLMPGDYLFLNLDNLSPVQQDRAGEPDVPGHPDIYRRPCFTQEEYDNRRKHDGNS